MKWFTVIGANYETLEPFVDYHKAIDSDAAKDATITARSDSPVIICCALKGKHKFQPQVLRSAIPNLIQSSKTPAPL